MKIEDKKIVQKLLEISKNGKSKQERIRAHALLLSNDGKKSQEIATIFGVTQRTVFQWFKDFKETGLNSLVQQSGRGRKTKNDKKDATSIALFSLKSYQSIPPQNVKTTFSKI